MVVGLYGYNTKDFVVSGHGSAADTKRNLEFAPGSTSNAPTRLNVVPDTVAADTISWVATADLTTWASMITAGTVKRVQVNVLPTLGLDQTKAVSATKYTSPGVPNAAYNPAIAVTGASVAVDLPTGTINAAPPGVAIVNSAKCLACHEALGTTFHGPNYGSAGVVACRVCHWVGAGGSHLEMQSRSIDSYVHALHQMQVMDIQNVNFADPVAKIRYEDHVEANYPNFAGPLNCESCHAAGAYEVPDQTKSLPGLISASRALIGTTRDIPATYPAQITGPAERACGGCHRAQMINEDSASSLAAFFAHTTMAGTTVTTGGSTNDPANLLNVTANLMGQIGQGPATALALLGAPAVVQVQVEGCEICHPTAGSDHQKKFNVWRNGTK